MNILEDVKTDIYNICYAELADYKQELATIKNIFVLNPPKEKAHGDLATNIAMILAAKLRKNPREIAGKITKLLATKLSYIANIEIAGPGFINISLQRVFFSEKLGEIYKNINDYGRINLGNRQKVNIEFGSPNPTGPIHVGHTRGSIFGDVLANLLEFCDYDVSRENYFNDAGKQIEILAESLYIRYQEIALKKEINIAAGLYPGDYLIDIAKDLYKEYADRFLNDDAYLEFFKEYAVTKIKDLITDNFAKLGIKHDVNFSEKSLHDNNKIAEAIKILKEKDLVYEGYLDKPKGVHDEDFKIEKQLLFKAKDFGDDSDRAIARADGSFTYFAADLAYHLDKIQRGYDKLILVLGADHAGYVKRMKALVKALSEDKVSIDIKLCQIVNYLENGIQLKMSKRSGNYVEATDVVAKIGTEVLRFLMLFRKNDMIFDFDLQEAISESKDNPVFYVQYAHARICSVFRKANNPDFKLLKIANLKYLDKEIEIDIIKEIMLFPEIISNSAKYYEPHRLAYYLYNLAGLFHSYWNLGQNSDFKFLSEEQNLREARLMLLYIIKNIIRTGLAIFNVQAKDEMR